MGRSILALIAGFVATFVFSVGIDAIVRATMPGAFGADGRTPSAAMMTISMAYTLVCAAAGGYITAWIAGRAELLHALALGTLGALSTLAIILLAPPAQRTLTLFASAMLVIPATAIGGWLRARVRAAAVARPGGPA